MVTKRTGRAGTSSTPRGAALWKRLAKYGRKILDAELENLPRDAARRFDDYEEGRLKAR